jgi:hypothetical protein
MFFIDRVLFWNQASALLCLRYLSAGCDYSLLRESWCALDAFGSLGKFPLIVDSCVCFQYLCGLYRSPRSNLSMHFYTFDISTISKWFEYPAIDYRWRKGRRCVSSLAEANSMVRDALFM